MGADDAGYPKRPNAPLGCSLRRQQRTAGGIANVVMTTGRVIDALVSTAANASFETNQLGKQPRVIEQFDALAVQ
jgi:hypothetical protein